MRSLLPFVAAMALAPAAYGATPSRQQAAALQAMLGFDVAMPVMLRDALDRRGGESWTQAQRDCVAAQVQPLMQESLDGAVAELFETADVAQAWLDFGATDAGRKMRDAVRGTVAAGLALKTGAVAPTASATPEPPEFSDAESMAMIAFMASPAAQVLSRDFPEPELDIERIEALGPGIESTCGVTFDR